MKKILLTLAAAVICGSAPAFNQALYVKKGDSFSKYNFRVAGDLKFIDKGTRLQVSGYQDIIDLADIDYISFNAPAIEGSLTPYAQKQKMIEIGEAVNNLVDQKNVGDLLRMIDAFLNHHEAGDKTFHPASEFEVPQEYWDVHNEFRAIMKSADALAKGNPAMIRTLRAKALNLYKASDYFGVYTANTQNHIWEKTSPADYLEIRFKGYDGTDYSLRLDCSNDCSFWETADFKGEFPSTMTFTFKVGSIKIAEMVMTSKLVKDESISINTLFTASKYKVEDSLNITNRLLTDNVKVYVNGQESIVANSTLNGANLVKYDIMKDDIKEATHYHDADDNCCGEDPERLISHFYRARTDVDVLGMLQAKAQCNNFPLLYDITNDEDLYDIARIGYPIKDINSDKSVISVWYSDYELNNNNDKLTRYLNDYADAQFFYDGKPGLQGFLAFENQEVYYDSILSEYNDYGYIITDNRLISVSRSSYWNDETQTYEDNVWSYFGPVIVDGQKEWRHIKVDEKDVIHPAKIRYTEMEVTPLLTFPDMTTYAFEDFFDENSFSDLINDYEEIIKTYEKITGQEDR